jgi:hypothetical protein
MRRTIYLFAFFASLFFAACREVVEVELPNEEPRLVVEAELNDTPGPHTVRLSLTDDYFADGNLPPVTDALVVISDNSGQQDTLAQPEEGLYLTQDLEGIIGRDYTLTILWRGNTYESTGTLLEEAVIDSLSYQYFPANPPVFKEGYYIFFFGKVPPGRTNYFRFKVFENDSLYNDRSDLLAQNDEFLPDTLSNIRFGYPFSQGDTVKLEMYTLNQEMYQYYLELITLLYNDGGLFSPPPQNPVSNIRNLSNSDQPPLGYFQVASITSDTIVIDSTGTTKK